jgi:hypothetical protein
MPAIFTRKDIQGYSILSGNYLHSLKNEGTRLAASGLSKIQLLENREGLLHKLNNIYNPTKLPLFLYKGQPPAHQKCRDR